MKELFLSLLGFAFAASQLLVPSQIAAQTSTPQQSTPAAVTLLQESVSASGGGQAPAAVAGVSASGTIAYNWAGNAVDGSVQLDWSNTGGMTLVSDTSVGKRTLSVTAYSGSLVDERGVTTAISSHNSARMQLQYLPSVELQQIVNNPFVVVQGGAEVSLSSGAADAIMISNYWPSNGQDSADQTVIFYLDHTTHLVVRRDDYVQMSASSPGRLSREMDYSGYQQTNGIALPTMVSETLNGQPLYNITWTQFTAQ